MTTLKIHRYNGEEDCSVFLEREPFITSYTKLTFNDDIQEDMMQSINVAEWEDGETVPFIMSHVNMRGPGYLILTLFKEPRKEVDDEGTDFIVFF